MTDNELTAKVGKMLFGQDLTEFNYATNPHWVGPIIEAAKAKGISLIVGPRGGTSDDYECEFGPLKGTSSSSRFGTLPRCVCLAVVAALEEMG